MPRGPRLDAVGALHHVMVRGLDRQNIFKTEDDRRDCVSRVAAILCDTGLTVLAWALLPNHLHFLVRTGRQPLATAMRRLLTGYAISFNHRHRRTGHLFQNRYKSILVEEEPYLLELVRYIHLNPIRAGLVADLKGLDVYPWSGHSALLGQVPRSWQAVDEVLAQFSARPREARWAYRAFVEDGIAQGRRSDLQGGGLRRSAKGWQAVLALRRGRERWAADERILGSSEFVTQALQEAPKSAPQLGPEPLAQLEQVLERVARAAGLTVAECRRGSRRRSVVAVRTQTSRLAVHELGLPVATVARALGVSPQTVLAALKRPMENRTLG